MRQKAKDLGRDPASIATHLYHNININADRQAALEESKKFLDIYYSTDYPMPSSSNGSLPARWRSASSTCVSSSGSASMR